VSILPKAIHKGTTIPTNISMSFSLENIILIIFLNYGTLKGPKSTIVLLSKQFGAITLPDLKFSAKNKGVKTLWF
jgi:hypothetical protein